MAETDQMKGRRGFLKRLLGMMVAPKVAASVPVAEKPVNALWKQALADYEATSNPFEPLNTAAALRLWLEQQKAKNMEAALLAGYLPPFVRHFDPVTGRLWTEDAEGRTVQVGNVNPEGQH